MSLGGNLVTEFSSRAITFFRMTPGKIQVIEDKETVNEVDDENLVSLETVNDIMLEEADPVAQSIQTFEKTEHGHLVEQILEVQRELEDNSRLTLAEDKLTGKTEIVLNCFICIK